MLTIKCIKHKFYKNIATSMPPVTDMPSTSLRISIDSPHGAPPADSCEFELTVVSAAGLCGTPVWSQSQGGYVTVAIGKKQIHKTVVADNGREPEWNDTFQFIAKHAHNLTISVYVFRTGRCDILLGETQVPLANLDRTGKEVNIKVSSKQTARPFTLNVRFEPRRRMFGLIIGIDKYKSRDIQDLQGCKRDAQSMIDLLSHKFCVPSSHFLCLADERATRSAIIAGFQKHLIENNNIEQGDAIVIFYAGHGNRVAAPKGWIADNDRVETICPHDERTIGPDGKEIFAIPDRTIGGLLRRLASIKGDNITVICDTCHSGGSTRTSRVARRAAGSSLIPADTDKDIWMWGLSGLEGPTGFTDNRMSTHVHIAACRQDESAFEDPSADNTIRGAFTQNLTKPLYQETDLSRITYSELLHLLPLLEQQHPQCNGKNKDRVLFKGIVGAHPTTFKLSNDDGIYSADAGDIHGVVKGTLFAIHACHNIPSIDLEIGILEADSVSAYSCTLRRRCEDIHFHIPPSARASVLNWRQRENVLRVFIHQPRNAIQSMENVFSLVNSSDSADLVIRHTTGGTLELERLDPVISRYARVLVLDNIRPNSCLSDILHGVAHFNFHLSRRNSANPLKQLIEVVLHRLTPSPQQISEEAIYLPDGIFNVPLIPYRENTVFIPSKGTTAKRVFYGLTVKNNSDRKLFPYLLNFDPSDYSIQSWYHPPAETMDAPLSPRHRNSRALDLKVGYGEAGVDALEFSLPDGLSSDVTFLKLFVSSVYIDMTVLEQSSPISGRGGPKMTKPPSTDVWDAWTYVLKTERQGVGKPT